ncbi:MAG: hypothetical protein RMK31_06420 [Candidatus Caldarchaeum sp.]|nr:hypothetical protein [Candidatus Caldarchaeum sp.]
MSIVFVADDSSDISLALALAKRGNQVYLHSPNPYVVGQAFQYSSRVHRDISRAEFVKLCSEGLFKNIPDQKKVSAEELWVCVNTIRNGHDTYAQAENQLKAAVSRVEDFNTFVLNGLTKPTEAQQLFTALQKNVNQSSYSAYFVGACQLICSKTPAWSSLGGTTTTTGTLSSLNPFYLETPEAAEAATITALASDALRRISVFYLIDFFKTNNAMKILFENGYFLLPKHVDVLKYLGQVSKKSPNILANAHRDLVKEINKRKHRITTELIKISRQGRRKINVMVVSGDSHTGEQLCLELSRREIKAVYVDEVEFEKRGASVSRGFDGVIVASSSLELMIEAEKACKAAWFLPLL